MVKKPFDPYATLGLDRTATEKDVRAAYRRKVKTAHPDAGGNATEFERLLCARLLLESPERRKRYDETGDTSDGPASANKIFADAVNTLGEVIAQALAVEQDPFGLDFVKAVTDFLNRERDPLVLSARKMKRGLERGQKMQARLTRKQKPAAGQSDVMVEVLRWQTARIRETLALTEHRLAVIDRAKEIIAEYTMAGDEPKPRPSPPLFPTSSGAYSETPRRHAT